MEGHLVSPTGCQLLDPPSRLRYHAVAIEEGLGKLLAHRTDYGEAQSEVGNEVATEGGEVKLPVHYVDVKPVGPQLYDLFALGLQVRKVAREDARSYYGLDGVRSGFHLFF